MMHDPEDFDLQRKDAKASVAFAIILLIMLAVVTWFLSWIGQMDFK